MSVAVQPDLARRSARSAASRNSRRSTCRCPTRRRDRGTRPAGARTRRRRPRGRASLPPVIPPPTRKCLTRSRTSSAARSLELSAAHSGPGWKQATRWSGRDQRAAPGRSCATSSSARGQRSANAHIVGSSRSDGTRPGISRSRRRASSLSYGRGIAPSRPIVYGCCGCGEQVGDRRLLGLAPGVHDEHAVGDVGDDAEVVGDQHDRGAEPLADVAHQVEDARLDRHVERGRRLVGDQHLRVARQRHRDHHALPHPAGELMRILVEPPLRRRDADELAAARSSASRASRRDRPRCFCSTSPICRPTVNTGLSDVIGSWKTNEIWRPRT